MRCARLLDCWRVADTRFRAAMIDGRARCCALRCAMMIMLRLLKDYAFAALRVDYRCYADACVMPPFLRAMSHVAAAFCC